jgi:hypothetical protein
MAVGVALIVFCLNTEPSLPNGKVVEFARANLGQRVGRGDCRSLAVEALRNAGARTHDPATSSRSTFSYPHHQNAGVAGGDGDDRKVFKEWTIDMAELKRGSVKAFRPVAERPA